MRKGSCGWVRATQDGESFQTGEESAHLGEWVALEMEMVTYGRVGGRGGGD